MDISPIRWPWNIKVNEAPHHERVLIFVPGAKKNTVQMAERWAIGFFNEHGNQVHPTAWCRPEDIQAAWFSSLTAPNERTRVLARVSGSKHDFQIVYAERLMNGAASFRTHGREVNVVEWAFLSEPEVLKTGYSGTRADTVIVDELPSVERLYNFDTERYPTPTFFGSVVAFFRDLFTKRASA